MFNNFNNNRITINTADFKISNVFYANSDDANGRILEVQLTDNGLIADSTGYSLELGFSTSQNTTGLVSFTVVDYAQGLYKIEYPTSMMIPGDVTCELRIFYLTNLTVSRSFIVNVSESVINEETITATNDFSALTTALGTINGFDIRITLLEQASDNATYLNHDANGDVTMPYFTDADKLGGYDSSYYAKQADLDAIVADVTVDSEVILARNSNLYGAYGSLDARLEAIEGKEKTDIQGVNIAIANSETAIKDLAETTKSVIPDVKVSTYNRSSVLSSNAREGQMNVKVSGNTMKNEVVNGNFANGTTGWNSTNSTSTSYMNTLTNTGNGSSANSYIATDLPNYNIGNRRKYIKAKVKVTNSICNNLMMYVYVGIGIDRSTSIPTPTNNVWYSLSFIAESTYGSDPNLSIWHQYADASTANGKVMEVKDVICIDMGSDSSNPLYNKTAAEMDAIAPYYFDGFSNVKTGVVRTVGKNLFDKFKATIGYYVGEVDGNLLSDSLFDSTDYIRVLPSTSYVKTSGFAFAFYDINKKFISGIKVGTAFTTPIGCAFVRSSVLHSAIDTFQIELGSVSTTYEKYFSTVAYLPYSNLKSLPNGIKDEVIL